ncbi:MAG: hypothetical protein MK077_05955 [Phycisphaerales bacterium]|nr:hypothetical protein [Phycisphaerales bacterium]
MKRLRRCAVVVCALVTSLSLAEPTPTPQVTPSQDVVIRLAFSDAKIDDLLDALSRMSGMAIVRATEVPAGTISFVSPEDHDLQSALQVLNIVLQARGVTIRQVDGMLRFEALADMQRNDIPTFVGTIPSDVTPDTLVTVMRPLDSASAQPIAERLSQMVGEYGAVVPMIGQNAVVITETASNVRRLLGLLEELDKQDPDGLIEVFPVMNVSPSDLIQPLQQLMTLKVETYRPDKKGKLVKVEETTMGNLTFTADDRAGLIIAKGSRPLLDKLGEIIQLLDVAGSEGSTSAGGRSTRTLVLNTLSPADATQRLHGVIMSMPDGERPQVLPLPERSSIIMTGPSTRVAELAAVVAELDGSPGLMRTQTVEVVAVEDATPAQVMASLNAALLPSQRAAVRMAPTPDARAIVLAGPLDRVAHAAAMIAALDVSPAAAPAIRRLKLRPGAIDDVMQRHADMLEQYDLTDDVVVRADPAHDVIELVGNPETVADRAAFLQSIAEGILEERVTRRFDLQHVRPSRVAKSVSTAARAMLSPTDGSPWTPPQVEAVDLIDALVVTSSPTDMSSITTIVSSIDQPQAGDFQVRVIPLSGAQEDAISQADEAFVQMGGGEGSLHRPNVEADRSGRRVVISGHTEGVRLYEQALRRYIELAGPAPVTRILTLRHIEPEEAAIRLADLASLHEGVASEGAPPHVSSLTDINAVGITATTRQQSLLAELVKALDVPNQATVEVVPLARSSAVDVAASVQRAIQARSMFEPGRPQANVSAVAASNAVIVTGTEPQVDYVKSVISQLDTGESFDEQQVRMVHLDHARADQVAAMMQSLMGLESLNEYERLQRLRYRIPLPDQGIGVRVVANERLNAVVIAGLAPAVDAAEEMVRQLDAVAGDQEDRTARAVRVIHVQHADPTSLAVSIEAVFADDQSKLPPVVRVDQSSGTLLVRADDAQMQLIDQVVGSVDAAAMTSSRQMQLIPIDPAQGDAGELAETLRRMLNRDGGPAIRVINIEDLLGADGPVPGAMLWSPRWLPVMAAIGAVQASVEAVGDSPAVSIAVDAETNSLVLVGSRRSVEQVRRLLEQLRSQMPKQAGRLHRIELGDRADASRLTRLVQQAMAQITPTAGRRGDLTRRVSIIPDVDTNAMIVSATDSDFESVTQIIKAVGVSNNDQSAIVKIYPLTNGAASRIARNLQELLRGTSASRQAGRMRHLAVTMMGGEDAVEAAFRPDRIQVSADSGSGSLVVMSPTEAIPFIDRYVELMDQSPVASAPTLQIFPLEHAAARPLSSMLRNVLRARYYAVAKTGAVQLQPDVSYDERTNALLVTADQSQLKEVASLLKQLDVPTSESLPPLRTIALKQARPSQAARLLQSTVIASSGAKGSSVVIVPDDASGLLLVRADEETSREIDAVLAEIDRDASVEYAVRTIRLERADAADVAKALQRLYDDRARIAGSKQRRVTIQGEAADRVLLVAANDEDYQAIQSLVAQLDVGAGNEQYEIRVFPLQHAKAAAVSGDVESMVNNLLYGDIWLMGSRNRKAPKSKVSIMADERTNAIVVTGYGAAFDSVEQVVSVLDQPAAPTLARTIKVYRVPRGSADLMSELIETAFGTQRRSWWRSASSNELQVRVDSNRRQIIVVGTSKEHSEIESMLASVNSADDAASSVQTFVLKSAKAADTANLLRQALSLDGQPIVLNDPDGGTSIVVEGRVLADTRSNSLLVTAPPRSMAVISGMIDEFDRLAPPVNQGVFIIDLQRVTSEEARRVVQELGLNRPARDSAAQRIVTDPITVTALPGRNALMVLGNPADRDALSAFFKSMDSEPDSADAMLKLVQLKNAQAEAVASVLRDMLDPSSQKTTSPRARAVQEQIRRLSMLGDGVHDPDIALDLTRPISITTHETQNALLISSTPDNLNAIVALVDLLDELPLSDSVIVRILPLDNLAASDFARVVRELFSQGKSLGGLGKRGWMGIPSSIVGRALMGDVAMTVHETTNTVVVAGTEDAVSTVEVLVDRLDSDVTTGWVDTQLVRLKWADPIETAAMLTRVLIDGTDAAPSASAMRQQVGRMRMLRSDQRSVAESDVFRPMHELVVLPHDTLNALLLVGTQDNLDIAGELVAMLDVEEASPASSVRFYPLDHGAASQIATTVTRLVDGQVSAGILEREDRVVAQTDERTNTLIVATSSRSFAVIEPIIQSLDSELTADYAEIRSFPLEHATSARMQNVVQRMMDARLARLRVVDQKTAELQRVTVMSDERTNSLIVAGGQDAFEVVGRLVKDLDGSDLVQRGLIEVIDAGDNNASRVAETVNAVMERRYIDLPPASRRAQMPLIQIDSRSNSLLVSAGPEDLDDIRDLIRRLSDAPTDPAIGLNLLAVNGAAQAADLAPRIERLMRDRQQSLGEASTPTDRVSIQSDNVSNSLIVAASRENLVVIEDFLRMLEQAESERGFGRELEVFHLQVTSARAMVDMLDDLYVREANRLRGSGTVRVTADEQLNAVMVSASESDVREISSLIGRLDGTAPSSVVEIRHVPLTSANALETVRLIEDVLSGRGLGRGRRAERATVLRYVRSNEDLGEGQEMQVSTALRESINLTPDVRTNTVIIKAPADSMDMLEDMIRDLDESSVGSKNVRIFKLDNADAAAMSVLLKDLFRLDEGDDLLVLKPRDGQDLSGMADGLEGMGGDFGGTELTAVPDPRQQLAITVDSRTNSLIVSGTPAYLDLVESVIDELDSAKANERDSHLYQLRNATASEVASVLGDFVETEQQKLIETIGVDQLGSAARLLEREVTIRGDDKSNSLLVSASPRYMERIQGLIKELDVDPPQVLIQVLLAEVSLDGGVDWGVDPSIGIGNWNFASFSPVVAAGLPSLTLGALDFNVVLRALENQGRLHILSNPSIMAANNEPANINVGEIIYVPVGATTYDTGLTSVPLQEKEVGVILSVTPSINPDGYVRMEVKPTLSKLGATFDQPAVGVNTPRIIQRTADTTVTVRDGQTIVIGGLINETYEFREDKVPILGDIPLLGKLFTSVNEQLDRTELVIVLTPHVVTSPTQLEEIRVMTDQQVDRLTLPPTLLDKIKTGELDKQGLFDQEGYDLKIRDLEEAITPSDLPVESSP